MHTVRAHVNVIYIQVEDRDLEVHENLGFSGGEHVLCKDFLHLPVFSSAVQCGDRLAPSGHGPLRQLSVPK